jgi:hypothetical protein
MLAAPFDKIRLARSLSGCGFRPSWIAANLRDNGTTQSRLSTVASQYLHIVDLLARGEHPEAVSTDISPVIRHLDEDCAVLPFFEVQLMLYYCFETSYSSRYGLIPKSRDHENLQSKSRPTTL